VIVLVMEKDDKTPGERYIYETQWPSYALAWSHRTDAQFRMAVGSYVQGSPNYVSVVEMNEETKKLEVISEIEHPMPPTKLMWWPCPGGKTKTDLFASTSTTLNIWKVEDGVTKSLTKLANTRKEQGKSGNLPPLTSFDWSSVNHHKVGASSVDTTCTIWNLEMQKVETQLIAHDKAVYDIAFAQSDHLFASVGADGSLRFFDQRNLDHSTIIYEANPPTPLLRLAWNKHNANQIATLAADTSGITLIDMRRPSVALASLTPPNDACVNSIMWAPHSRHHLLCGSNDGHALIWDMKELPQPEKKSSKSSPEVMKLNPLLAYETDSEVLNVQWPSASPDFVALGMSKQIEVLQV